MARDGGVSCLRRSEMIGVGIGGMESSPLDLDEVHVLAVDDSLVDRIVIERLLRITSCKVTAVDSGWRALEFLGLGNEKTSVELDRLKVDLIITDYCMPGMTGYELLKKIKESTNFREVPVVIMSSENVLTRIDRCLEEGAEDFLLKPVKLADVKRLRNCLTTRDIKLSNGNKRKLPEGSADDNLLPPPSLPPSPPSPISPESSESSQPLSPPEISSSPLSSPLTSPVSDDDFSSSSPSPEDSPPPEFLTSPVDLPLPGVPPAPEDSPTRRQKMSNPGLD